MIFIVIPQSILREHVSPVFHGKDYVFFNTY